MKTLNKDHYFIMNIEFLAVNNFENIYKYEMDQDESYKDEWLHFIDCINKKITPKISFQDGIKVLNIIESIKIASSSGKKVLVK